MNTLSKRDYLRQKYNNFQLYLITNSSVDSFELESNEDESNVEIKYVPSEEIYGAFCDEDWAVIGRSSRAFIVLWCFSQESKHFLMS